MHLLVDFIPVIVFFVAFKVYDMFIATAALIAAMAILIGYQWLRHRKVSKMLLVSGVVVALLGGITLTTRNLAFIQWKPTIVNWLFAGAFLGSQLFTGKTLIERVMGHAMELDAHLWRQLNLMWVVFFFVLGCANLYVVYNFDEATWVNFKVFGIIGLSVLMAVGQAFWISSRTAQSDTKKEP